MQLAEAIDAWRETHESSLSASTIRDIAHIAASVEATGWASLPCGEVDRDIREDIIDEATTTGTLGGSAISEFLTVVLSWESSQAESLADSHHELGPTGAFDEDDGIAETPRTADEGVDTTASDEPPTADALASEPAWLDDTVTEQPADEPVATADEADEADTDATEPDAADEAGGADDDATEPDAADEAGGADEADEADTDSTESATADEADEADHEQDAETTAPDAESDDHEGVDDEGDLAVAELGWLDDQDTDSDSDDPDSEPDDDAESGDLDMGTEPDEDEPEDEADSNLDSDDLDSDDEDTNDDTTDLDMGTEPDEDEPDDEADSNLDSDDLDSDDEDTNDDTTDVDSDDPHSEPDDDTTDLDMGTEPDEMVDPDEAAASSFFSALGASAPADDVDNADVTLALEPTPAPAKVGVFSAAAEHIPPKPATGVDWVTVAYFTVAAICFALVIYFYLSS